MEDEFYVECFLQTTGGVTKLAELACERNGPAQEALAENLTKIYRAEDGSRIRLDLRRAVPADVAAVTDLLQASKSSALKAAWADAAVRLASGTQKTQFNSENCAPAGWVEAIESARVRNARWRDASWGNNAAPSWELFDGNQVLAETFFYSTENGERFTRLYDEKPYLEVALLDEDGDIIGGFQTSPDTFQLILEAADGYDAPPFGAFKKAAEAACDDGRARWSQSD